MFEHEGFLSKGHFAKLNSCRAAVLPCASLVNLSRAPKWGGSKGGGGGGTHTRGGGYLGGETQMNQYQVLAGVAEGAF